MSRYDPDWKYWGTDVTCYMTREEYMKTSEEEYWQHRSQDEEEERKIEEEQEKKDVEEYIHELIDMSHEDKDQDTGPYWNRKVLGCARSSTYKSMVRTKKERKMKNSDKIRKK